MMLADRKICCGCASCAQLCPQNCISMVEDAEGFPYPAIDASRCIDCGKCGEVCPALHKRDARLPEAVYAAVNCDDAVRSASSSGGIFSLLASKVIEKGGAVFGARFNGQWEVEHAVAATQEECVAFRGSKYVQSRMGDSFNRVAALLEEGRRVLFSGTPCQIAAINLYPLPQRENLLTVDVVCHSVPSPGVWRDYLNEVAGGAGNVGDVNFRDKSTGWRNFSLTIKGRDGRVLLSERCSDNAYMQDFLKNRNIRPSCFSCPAREGRSGSDITIADFWGITKTHPELDDNGGTGLVMINTGKGRKAFQEIAESGSIRFSEASYEQAVARNRAIVSDPEKP